MEGKIGCLVPYPILPPDDLPQYKLTFGDSVPNIAGVHCQNFTNPGGTHLSYDFGGGVTGGWYMI